MGWWGLENPHEGDFTVKLANLIATLVSLIGMLIILPILMVAFACIFLHRKVKKVVRASKMKRHKKAFEDLSHED